MKQRLYLMILLAAVTLSSTAQTIGDAFYIYRNDGQFNAFFREEVISIEYSNEDAEGNTYDEIVTQIVNTADSVYKIPLAAIDSVGFVTPETQYKPGVVKIEGELRQYVVSSDEMQITFSSSIPSALLPRIDDKLVTLEQSDTFPYGFLGGVVSMEVDANGNHLVKCEAVSMRDVFDCYYGVSSKTYTEQSPTFIRSNRVSFGGGFANFNPGTFRFPLTYGLDYSIQIDDDYAYEYSPNMFFEFTPKLRVSAFIILPIGGDKDTYVSLTCIGDFHMLQHIEASGSLQWGKDWGWTSPDTHLPHLSWPIPDCPLVRFYIEPGIFINASTKISSQMEFTQDYQLKFHYDASLNHGPSLKQVPPQWTPVSYSSSAQLTMTGSVAFGGYAEMGFLFRDKDFAHLCLRGEIGIEAESNAVLLKEDINTATASTSVYERFHDTALSLNWFYGSKLEGRIWPFTASYNLPVGKKGNIYSLGHVPTFSDVSLKKTSEGTLYAEAEVSGNLLNPVEVGFALFTDNNENLGTYFSGTFYYNQTSKLSYTFTNVEEGHDYVVYPVVRVYGIEMLAYPSSRGKDETSCPDENHPHWIDLGLPSGTLWQCCNEGASSPRDYGEYYNFGEIESAPSSSQISELISNTTYVYSSGGKFTGPNGNFIFFPAAGYNNGYDSGKECAHWSSTPNGRFGYTLKCSRNRAKLGSSDEYGIRLPVRPVRRKD